MPINLDGLGVDTPNGSGMADTTSNVQKGISANLMKGMSFDLTKDDESLKNIVVGTGWNFDSNNVIDCDLFAVLLHGTDKKVRSNNDLIFYKNRFASGIELSEDNRTGIGDGDDEFININLSEVDSDVTEILLGTSIYNSNGKKENQKFFGMNSNAYMRVYNPDKENQELCRCSLSDDFSLDVLILCATLSRDGSNWHFNVVAKGFSHVNDDENKPYHNMITFVNEHYI